MRYKNEKIETKITGAERQSNRGKTVTCVAYLMGAFRRKAEPKAGDLVALQIGEGVERPRWRLHCAIDLAIIDSRHRVQ